MTSGNRREDERMLGLLADRATEGLDPGDEILLRELLTRNPEVDPDCMDRAAAAAYLAWMGAPSEPLPGALRQRLEQRARSLTGPPGDCGRR